MKKKFTAKAGELFAGRYMIKCLLGEGGMGTVYLAQDTLLADETIALKILATESGAADKHSRAFLQTVQLARRVIHPNVVRTFDAGACDGQVFFSMEYAPGVTLRETLDKSGIIDSGQVVFVLYQVAAGLQAIHEAGIVHGDLKLCNLIMTPQGQVKIADLGLAHSGALSGDQDDEILGSWAYLAPEIWSGHESTPLSDIYAMGVLAYELLTSKVPFDAQGSSEMMRLHLEEIPHSLSGSSLAVPFWLEKLILKMLEKNPEKRPQTAGAVCDLLRETVEAGEVDLPFSLPDESAPHAARKPSRESPLDGAISKLSKAKRSSSDQTDNDSPASSEKHLKCSPVCGSFFKCAVRMLLTAALGIVFLGLFVTGPGGWIAEIWRDEAVLVSPLLFFQAFVAVMFYSAGLAAFPVFLLAASVLSPSRSLLVFAKMLLIQTALWVVVYCRFAAQLFYDAGVSSESLSYATLASFIRPASETILQNSFLLLRERFAEYAGILSSHTDSVAEAVPTGSVAGVLLLCLYVLSGVAFLHAEFFRGQRARFFNILVHAGAFLMLCFLANVFVSCLSPQIAEIVLPGVFYLPVGPFTEAFSGVTTGGAVLSWLIAGLVTVSLAGKPRRNN